LHYNDAFDKRWIDEAEREVAWSLSSEIQQVWGALEQFFPRLHERDAVLASEHTDAQAALQGKLDTQIAHQKKVSL